MAIFTLGREERLKKKKQIDLLFGSGRSFYFYPYKVFWALTDEDESYPAQVLISASKRSMKNAVDRNRVKRQTRELYRYQKPRLYKYLSAANRHALIGIIYTGKTKLEFEEAREKIIYIVDRLIKEFEKQLSQ